MSLRTRTKERLKSKFPNVNLSTKRTNALAAALEEDLEDEATDEEIDAELDRINKFAPFAETAKLDDELRNFRSKEKKEPGEEGGEKKDPKTEEPDKVDPKTKTEQPDFEAILGKVLAPVLAEIATLKADKTTGSRTAKLNVAIEKADDKFKKTTLGSFKRMKDMSDEEFEEYLEEVTEDAKEWIQADANKSLDNSVAPLMGVKNKSGVSSDVESFITSKKEAAKGTDGLAGKSLFPQTS